MTTLYDELGVSRDASQQQLRRAYRERARALHPDLNPGPDAEAAIRRLNETWSILGDPAARRRYDETLRDRRGATVRAAPVQPRQKPPVGPAWLWLLKPSVLVLAVLGVIFVITAYAGPHSPDRAPRMREPTTAPNPHTTQTTAAPGANSLVGRCLLIQPGYDALTPCSQPNNGQVVAEVAELSQCPPGSTGYQLAGRAQLVCLIAER